MTVHLHAIEDVDVVAVLAVMSRHVGPANAATWRQIARELGYRDDRKLRRIVAEHDGDAFLLGSNARGLFLATAPEQAAAYQAELDAKVLALLRRRSRRKRLARAWVVRPVVQAEMGWAS